MKNKMLIAYSILAVCYEELLAHSTGWDQDRQFYCDDKRHGIAVIQNGPDYEPIPRHLIWDKLLQWVLESLTEHKIVLLYTCRDNGEISIDDVREFTEDLDMLEDSFIPELKHILYVAND